ncbi:MAG: hypothetical protein P8N09_07495 [Planctomycetota bacterium]|jgi:hypothetical protein|nr:hypothetical protein [Planctomycetota bacterium]
MLARRLFAAALTLGLALTLPAAGEDPFASYVLNDTWFVLKVSGKGYHLNESNEATKAKFKTTAYMELAGTECLCLGGPSGQDYEVTLWTQVSEGLWTDSHEDTWHFFGEDTLMFVDESVDFAVGPLEYFSGSHTAKFTNKLDKGGRLKKSTYQSMGGLVTDGTTNGLDTALGGYRIKGKSIHQSKLPFDPE